MMSGTALAADAVAVMPFDKICAYEKWKKVSFDGYLDARKMSCKGTKNRRTGTTTTKECALSALATPS